ncbi:MAG: sigma 54-interacting transcriptional regulator [Nannocystaceae bacterium]|nr:sigma 54-interacting transcriptional regulator [Nannocystaceae bacterium]
MAPRHKTREDPQRPEREGPVLMLASVGSPEDEFADAGRLFPLDGVSRVVFGRGEDHAARIEVSLGDGGSLSVGIPLPYVSARHAELVIAPSDEKHGHRLEDNGSRNGTLLEGKALERDTAVLPGDIFEIGRSFWALVELSPTDNEVEISRIDPDGAINPQMRTLLTALGRVATSSLPLLLTGETGVGKDRLADAVHRASGVAGELVVANVMATTIEQLLFGGTGEIGLMQRARGGTLVLDDVGELDSDAQTKLQSALMTMTPSSGEAREGDVRVIAASTRDLRNMVSLEGFRPDLMSRLAGFEGAVPPLRERREDLGILVRALSRRPDGSQVPVSTPVFRSMLAHAWPFNVRELEHALKAAVSLTCDVSAGSSAASGTRGITPSMWEALGGHAEETRDPVRIQAVREALVQYLVAHGGDTARVAESMHCGLQDVERWLDRLSLRSDEYGRAG